MTFFTCPRVSSDIFDLFLCSHYSVMKLVSISSEKGVLGPRGPGSCRELDFFSTTKRFKFARNWLQVSIALRGNFALSREFRL